jgi:RimJ/RimL family protein N-acetyltransferase
MIPGTVIQEFITKKNRKAVIRVIQAADFENLFEYANNLIAEDTFVMLSGEPMTREAEQKYLDDVISKVQTDRKIHFVVDVGGKFAGSCEVRIFDKRKSHVGEIGISLSPDFREEGIGTVCLNCLIDSARKLGLRLLTLTCFEINVRAVRTYEKVGFKKAGVIPGMYHYQEKYENEVIMYLNL